MKYEWSDNSSDKLSVHRAIPEGGLINTDAQVTFGIEMEFLVPYIIKGQPDPHANDPRPVIELTEEDAMYSSRPSEAILRQIRSKIDHLFSGTEEIHMSSDLLMMGYRGTGNKEHKKWTLKEDQSLTECAYVQDEFAYSEDESYAGWVSVEIVSRIFRSEHASDIARNAWVIGQIARNVRWDIRCRINDTCGLHVHVGLEDSLPHRLHGLKKLATVLWLAEDLLEKLYHPARREENRPLNFYCRSMKKCSLLGTTSVTDMNDPNDEFYKKYLHEIFQKDRSLALKMGEIWATESTERLIELLGPASGWMERLSYNFQSLDKIDGHGTLEFRAMESTMNEELLKHWPYVCQMLLRIAKRHPEADHGGRTESECYRDLIKVLVDRPEGFDTWAFLKLIYVDEDTIKFFKKKQKWDAESWEQLSAGGSPRELHNYTFQYRPSAEFFATKQMSEYGYTQ